MKFATKYFSALSLFYLVVGTRAANIRGALQEHHHGTSSLRTLIVGGNDADPGEYPTFAASGDGSCGATLIHPDILLTAAHCTGFTGVYIGSSQLTGGGKPYLATVSEHPHPDYSDDGDSHDIMLVKLATPQNDITPQRLNFDDSVPLDGDAVTVIGFGALVNGGQSVPDTLQEVTVQVRNYDECRDAYTQNEVVEDHHICAADPNGGRDSCQGDSGGPLFTSDGIQIGISSFDNGSCGSPDGGVYVRVSHYREWIENTICEVSCNPPPSCTTTVPTSCTTETVTAPPPSITNDGGDGDDTDDDMGDDGFDDDGFDDYGP